MALAVSWDGTTMEITGGTSGTPITWADVWDYDTDSTDVNGAGDTDGTAVALNTLMTEVIEDSVYTIDVPVEIGDGSTPTYFQSKSEHVIFDLQAVCEVQAAATLEIGDLYGDWGIFGSSWDIGGTNNSDNLNFCDGGTLLIYASKIWGNNTSSLTFNTGTLKIKNSILGYDFQSDWNWRRRYVVQSGMTTVEFEDVFIYGTQSLLLRMNPGVFENVHMHRGSVGVESGANGIVVLGFKSSSNNDDLKTWTSGAAFDIAGRDMDDAISSVVNVGNDASWCAEQFTCNINICDKDGTALQSVVVDCLGSDSGTASTEYDTAQWTAGTITTDASGDIAEQVITQKKWVGTAETLTNYNYFKFTLSKAGYETLILENITVDAPIAWHLELKGPVRYKLGSDTFFEDDS